MLLLLLTASVVQTGPVIRSRRMIREIYVENSAATVPENTPEVSSSSSSTNATASDMCLYDGSYVERSAIACEKKHGCRAIQKTGECCPDYQCECQRDGKTYATGEKVFDPNTPCRSCYCQGGEITCSVVSCYKRNDCDPKYIPGRCCPEYDNCPPLENFKITESSTTNTKDGEQERAEETNEVKGNYAAEAEDLLASGGLQKVSTTSTTSTSTTAASTTLVPSAMSNENPLGIKIKEITKPEEIRLTDNRPSAGEQQMQQQQQFAMAAAAAAAAAAAGRNTTPEPSTSQSEELVNLEHLDVNVPDDDGENGTKIVRHTDGDGVRSEEDTVRKEPSSSEESQKVVENRLESGESSTTAGSVSSSTLSESDEWLDVKEVAESSSSWASTSGPSYGLSSTTTPVPPMAPSTSGPPPVAQEEHEEGASESSMKLSKPENALPAVVQIGDKLVIVDHNQPKPITVIQVEEVEGLQRGEDDTVYDQEAYTERSHHHSAESGRESSKKLKLHSSAEQEQETLSTQADSSGSYETIYHTGSSEQVNGPVSSEEIFETQLYTEGPEDAATGAVNDTQPQQGEPLSVSREDFLHMDPAQEPAKLQQEQEDHTVGASGAGVGISSAFSSTEEGSTTMSDMSGVSFSSEASGDEMIYDTHFYTEGPNTSSEEAKDQKMTAATGSEETSTVGSTYVPRNPPAVADELTPQTYIEDNEPELIHPGFQPIPEDFSLPQLDQPAMEMSDMMDHNMAAAPKQVPEKQEKILSEVLELKSNGSASTAHPEVSSTTEGGSPSEQEESSNSPAWLKEDPQPQLRAPGEPLLIPEWERKNGTNSTSSEEESTGDDMRVLKMGSEEYDDTVVEGSGALSSTTVTPSKAEVRSEEKEDDDDDDEDAGKSRSSVEQAVASGSAKAVADIDGPASASATDGQGSDTVNHNPKNDVESLKADEDENNATADEAIPKKVQQLEVDERAFTLTSV
ncbi:hypothetical protein ZHAS_00013064 [Anopheles sinensis]|uniref:VWFC domain-containing protein n=1 Tax=Anopheles sinensis TaxID=74873 RepID=A0A084W4T4_ANOSI|nr:hypothetical protein ZHAS_00013064 [Anopheles sinensis]